MRALEHRGLPDEAIDWFASFAEDPAFGRVFQAPSHLRRAEILNGLGRTAEAAHHLERFLAQWRDADPEAAAILTHARELVKQRR